MSTLSMMQPFNPEQEVNVVYRRLPHWSQAGAIAFITWRTWDSMPEHVIRQWQNERAEWLKSHGVDPAICESQEGVERLGPAMVNQMKQFLADRWNDHLDDCHGACVLRRPDLSLIVENSLRHFDGDRYQLTDFVVMPNHVHVLVAFPSDDAMLEQCDSWKHFTAAKINRVLGRKGRFWLQEAFDHLVRSQQQYDYLRGYLASNPEKANLRPGEYRVYSSRSAR
jgi:REP element-mobilizing transposase RayT